MGQEQDQVYLRDGIYELEDVLPLILLGRQPHVKKLPITEVKSGVKANEVIFSGKIVKMSSKRLRTFRLKGIACVTCGLTGQYFALERHKVLSNHSDPNVWHFNLYAVDTDGLEVLMTRDHVVPLSRGGPDSLSNSQTMCARCNNKKGNTV